MSPSYASILHHAQCFQSLLWSHTRDGIINNTTEWDLKSYQITYKSKLSVKTKRVSRGWRVNLLLSPFTVRRRPKRYLRHLSLVILVILRCRISPNSPAIPFIIHRQIHTSCALLLDRSYLDGFSNISAPTASGMIGIKDINFSISSAGLQPSSVPLWWRELRFCDLLNNDPL